MFDLKDLGITRKRTKLSNGTNVVVFERPGMPICISAGFLAGSRFNPKGKEGVAHFLEHMLLAGTKAFPTKDKLALFIEGLGGVTGGSTSPETVELYADIGEPEDLGAAFRVLSEEVKHSLFKDTQLETERGSILRELADKKCTPAGLLAETALQNVYQGTVVGRSGLGSDETIKAITKQDILDFKEKMLVAENLVIMVAGGVTTEEVVKMAEKYLLLPNGKRAQIKGKLPIVRDNPVSIANVPNIDQIKIDIDFRTAGYDNNDKYALMIIASILGGGRASILTRKLRYEKGLVYSVGAGTSTIYDAGSFFVDTSCYKENIQEITDIIFDEIRKVQKDGLEEADIQFTKDRSIKSAKRTLQTTASWINNHFYRSLIDPEKDWTVADYFSSLSAVTVSDVKRVANKYFTSENWYVTAVGNITDKDIKVGF